MHKLKTYIRESIIMAMTILVAGCLYHPDQTNFFSSLDMYLISLQKSCRGSEHSYTFVLVYITFVLGYITFVLGYINNSDTDRK